MRTFWLFTPLYLIGNASAHYTFSRLIVNGTVSEDWKYIRDIVQDYGDLTVYHKLAPHYWSRTKNFTCGRSAYQFARKTQTADVVAGSEVGFKTGEFSDEFRTWDTIWHGGPAQIYMSKSPNSLEEYDGDGDWFKIAYFGPSNDTEWSTMGKKEVRFTIPKSTPPGVYLLRIEQFSPHLALNDTQYFINCAHVNVMGNGGGTPKGFARFPPGYDLMDPGVWVSHDIFYSKALMKYQPPGPPVWNE